MTTEQTGGGDTATAAEPSLAASAAAAATIPTTADPAAKPADDPKAAPAAAADPTKTAPDLTNAAKAKPNDVPDEFWDKDKGELKTTELLKSQRDLREKVSKGLKEPAPETPDKYDLKFNETVAKILPSDDPTLPAIRKAAHKAGISNAALNALINEAYPEMMQAAMDAVGKSKQTPEQQAEATAAANKAELAKLHSDPVEANKIVNGVVGFFKGKVDQGSLSQDDYAALMRMGGDAAGIAALRKMISVVYNAPDIPGADTTITGGYSVEQYHRDVGSAKYQTDAGFRAECKAKLAKITGDQPGGQAPVGFGHPAGTRFTTPAESAASKKKA